MTKKLKIALIASVLSGSFSCFYAGGSSLIDSTYEKAQQAYSSNKVEATKLFEKSCNEGVAKGCSDLAYMYRYGHGVIKDDIKALELYEKACKSGESTACNNAEQISEMGKKSPLFNQALTNCKSGSVEWCGALGVHYYKGDGTDINLYLAEKYLQQSCDAGYPKWCAWLGALKYNNKDYFKAFEYFNKACAAGFVDQCNDVGYLYANGQGTRLDIAKATEFYGKSCDMKNQKGCESYKRLKSPQPVQQVVNNNSNSNYQQEQLNILRQQQQAQQKRQAQQDSDNAWSSIGQSLNSIGNAFNQSAYQNNQQSQLNETNRQLRNINNSLDNFNSGSKLRPIRTNFY